MGKPYFGRILLFDLSKKKHVVETLNESLYRRFIGGASLASYLYANYFNPQSDAFSPDNPLIFMTGPLTGTLTPSSGRHAVVSRSPLTSLLGEATTGGHWGTFLKKAGYDGIVILGKADEPVYIYIDENEISIVKAGGIWGKNYYETLKLLKERHGKKVKVSSIGKAGEKLVKISGIINDHGRAAGRTGLGAVMGSKKLKAIVVYGEKEIEVHDDKFYDYNREKLKEMRESTGVEMFRNYGTSFYVDLGYSLGDLPAKYYREGEFPAEKISGITLAEKFNVKPIACYACPIACGRVVRTDDNVIDGPEYETLVMLGAQNMVFDLDPILIANHLCNDYGLDTISTGAVISFAHFLYEKGYLKEENIGFPLKWGEGENLIKLVEAIGEREGIGNLLAEGVAEMARKLGVEVDLVATVKGLEIPAHDPRASFGQALTYATTNRGADHLRGDFYLVDIGAFEDREFGIVSGDRFEILSRVEHVIRMQNFREIFNSLAICIFTNFTAREVTDYLNLATGWDIDINELNLIGERTFNLKRLINNVHGARREDDKLPKIVLEPYQNGNIAGMTPKDVMDEAIEKYYQLRRWDSETGFPLRENLVKLGLNDVINTLENKGVKI